MDIMSNTWETGICGCCDVKDCGIGCCVKLYCVRLKSTYIAVPGTSAPATNIQSLVRVIG